MTYLAEIETDVAWLLCNRQTAPTRIALERIDNPEQKDKLLSAISSHSPMSWAHTNLLGEYDFSDEKLKDTAGIRPPKIAT